MAPVVLIAHKPRHIVANENEVSSRIIIGDFIIIGYNIVIGVKLRIGDDCVSLMTHDFVYASRYEKYAIGYIHFHYIKHHCQVLLHRIEKELSNLTLGYTWGVYRNPALDWLLAQLANMVLADMW
jgi:hypothetical protein